MVTAGTSVAKPEKQRHPIVVGVGLFLSGLMTGLIISVFFPSRLMPVLLLRGTSLVLSPLIAGFVMELYGIWREEHGKIRSPLATFWGGGLLAFGIALARFAMVG